MNIPKTSFYYCLVFLAFISFTGLHAQQVFKATTKTVIGYLEYLPPDYTSNSNKYPVVIFLHGIGERGPASTDLSVLSQGIGPVANLGPPKYVKNGHKFPFILISPQLKSNYGTWPAWYIDEVVEHVKTNLRIDESRIYVTGLSLGGGGAWVYAETYPEKVAALAPVCGGYNTPSKACNIANNKVPVWAFHGDKDYIVGLSTTLNMINAIKNCLPAPSPSPLLTIYTGIAHNAWDKAYTIDHSVHSPNVYEWMTSHTNTVNGSNNIPKANAGTDITRTLPVGSVTINGSGTDAGGSIASYAWAQIEGPSTATLSNASAATLTVSNLTAGKYTFRLRVTDNNGATDSDYVSLTIQQGSSNTPPVANAGSDKTITLPTNAVTLNGSGSDPDGSVASYSWTKVSGGTASLSGTNTQNLNASNLVEGTYTFRLTVTDNKGATKSDDAVVTVKKSTTNILPNVYPGPSQTISTNSVTLTGTASDPDGTIVAYEWFQTSGPNAATLTNKHTITLTASNLVTGEYMFRLMVTDNDNGKRSGYIQIRVNNTNTNAAPTADAGGIKTIALPTNSVTIHGNGDDPDGTITSYNWTKVSGGTASLSGTTTPDLSANGLTEGTYVFRLTVRDDKGAVSSDDATVTVNGSNQLPIVYPGPSQTITLPTNSVTFVGTASDPDGTIVAYEWFQSSGPNTATLNNKNTISLTASNLIAGVYMFRLMVTDNNNGKRSGYVRVTVNPAGQTSARVQSYDTPEDTSLIDETENSDNELLGCQCHANIFDETGQKIFSGKWTSDRYHEVFTQGGLYFYHILDSNNEVKKGKIFIVK